MLGFITAVLVATGSVLTAGINKEHQDNSDLYCELPPYPDKGRYVVQDHPDHSPGQLFTGVVFINVTCDLGYATDGPSVVLMPCYPEVDLTYIIRPCRRYCVLPSYHSVDYECRTSKGGATQSKPCGDKVFIGTTVVSRCRPNYRGTPSPMRCTEDGWNHIAKCAPSFSDDRHDECGQIPQSQEYIIGEKRVEVGEVPWHVGIYSKTFRPFKHICGGSIVTTTAVITAAHCFWKGGEGRLPPHLFAVAVGKIYRPWGDVHDVGAQFSNIIDIVMPDTFRGSETNYQDDIAVAILQKEIVYNPYIRPVCVSFDSQLNRRQLMPGNRGKIAGWGSTTDNRKIAQVLQVAELTFIAYDKCYDEAPPGFREFITKAKICAGFQNGTALCHGYSGGGLAFPEYELGVERYYLQGIASVAARDDNYDCNPSQPTAFTELIKHETWTKRVLYTGDF